MGTAVTMPDGSWRTPVTFPRTGHVRATFGGDAARGALASAQRRIAVLASLQLKLGRNRVPLGESFKASGRAVPAEQVKFTFQRRVRRHWVTKRRRVLPVADDHYKVRIRPRVRGKYRVNVWVGRVKRHRQLKVL
jgi:hypothetical protein